jgi:putative methyltransferase
MKKNILLVQVVDNYGENKFLPLAIGYQWLHATKDDKVKLTWNLVDVLIEKLNIVDFVKSIKQDLDLVAMSSYVWNWNFNNELAKEIKKRWPGCVIVVGGPEVNKHDPDLVRNRPWFDVAVLGENETAFESLLTDLDLQRITDIPGVITKYTKQIVQPERTKELTEIPSPILSGFYDDIIEKYTKTGTPIKYWQVTWETMRGCPYHCAFCDIGEDYWNKTIWFDIERLYKEIDWMGENKIEYLSVCDSNWGIHPRDVELTKYIIETKKRTGYPKILDVTWAKNNPDRVREIIQLDYEAGSNLLRGLNFSMQSLDSNTLKINSRFNLQDDKLYNSLAWYREKNIPTFTELIWPLPGETVSSFAKGLQTLIDFGQKDFLVIHPLVATTNSPLGVSEFRKEQKIGTSVVPVDTFWLKITDPEAYIVETEEAVTSTGSASYEDYLKGNMIGHWLVVMYYYGWANMIMQYLRQTNNIKEVKFVQDLIQYFSVRPDSLIGQEHYATVNSYKSVIENFDFWGRTLDAPYNDVYWEYKSATAIVFYQNKDLLQQCLKDFLRDVYQVNEPDLIKLNFDLCVDHSQQYPVTHTYDPRITDKLLGISDGNVVFDHRDKSLVSGNIDLQQFLITVYHYKRKLKYWKCDTRHKEN